MNADGTPPLTIIVAMTRDRVIGRNGTIPWHVSEDLKLLKKTTMGGTVIMGRTTWLSIGKPLPGRTNIVISSTLEHSDGITVCRNIEEALLSARNLEKEIYCLGGASIYKQMMPFADRMLISIIPGNYTGDTFFPEFDDSNWSLEGTEQFEEFSRLVYKRV